MRVLIPVRKRTNGIFPELASGATAHKAACACERRSGCNIIWNWLYGRTPDSGVDRCVAAIELGVRPAMYNRNSQKLRGALLVVRRFPASICFMLV